MVETTGMYCGGVGVELKVDGEYLVLEEKSNKQSRQICDLYAVVREETSLVMKTFEKD